jgi:D-alanyl-D-alanine dipeptidase
MNLQRTSHQKRIRRVTAGMTSVIVLCIWMLTPAAAFAIEVNLEVPFGEVTKVTGLANYLQVINQYIVTSIGLLATVMIMVHGLQWALASGNSDIISRAKGGIINAITGVVLAFLSFVILNTINTQLTSFDEPALPQTEIREDANLDQTAPAASSPGCDNLKDFSPLMTTYSSVVSFSGSSKKCINEQGYDALERALQLLNDPSNTDYYGMKLRIASAYRSTDQQNILYQCYQQGCGTTVGNHKCTSCNKAAKPGSSNHEKGNALDVQWAPRGVIVSKYVSNQGFGNSTFHKECMVKGSKAFGVVNGCTQQVYDSIVALNRMMDEAGFKRICIEWWHHQIGGSSTCRPGVYR